VDTPYSISYVNIPSAAQFRKDSSVRLAIRSDDTILKHIDWLLERYDENVGLGKFSRYMVILGDLFLTCNFWLKSYYQKNPLMKKGRYPAVIALFEAVVGRLIVELKCDRHQVARTIDEIYNRDLHKHGLQVDGLSKRAQYFSKKERQIYRLRFRGGIVYQHRWWQNPPSMELTLAESRRAYNGTITRAGNAGSVDYGGFIMTMERELFMAKHWIGDIDSRAGVFHSSYTAGDRVIMAGNMLIKGGVIWAIRSDSGHYQPTEMNMAALLQALGMLGVSLRRIALFDYKNNPLGTAPDFLKARESWDQFVQQRTDERQNRKESDDYRQDTLGQKPRFPHLQPKSAPQTMPQPTASSNVGQLDNKYILTKVE
jgi:hypothetical protein